jgi:hypothetical protein
VNDKQLIIAQEALTKDAPDSDKPSLRRIFDCTRRLSRRADVPAPTVCSPSDLVVVCDDHTFWGPVLAPIVESALAVSLEQVSDLQSLAARLDALAGQAPRKSVVVLLDVRYQSRDGGAEVVLGPQDLRNTVNHPLHPSVILFTSDRAQGVLVRETYERGALCFFKEMDDATGSRRDTIAYARKLVSTIEVAIRFAPLNDLMIYTDTLFGEDGLAHEIREYLGMWRRHRIPHLLAALAGQWERVCRETASRFDIHIGGRTAGEILKDIRDMMDREERIEGNLLWLGLPTRNYVAHEMSDALQRDNDTLTGWQVGLGLALITSIWAFSRMQDTYGRVRFQYPTRDQMAALAQAMYNILRRFHAEVPPIPSKAKKRWLGGFRAMEAWRSSEQYPGTGEQYRFFLQTIGELVEVEIDEHGKGTARVIGENDRRGVLRCTNESVETGLVLLWQTVQFSVLTLLGGLP